MFNFNRITQVLRESADDDGDGSLGISGGDSNGIFAGADTDWQESGSIEDFEALDGQKLTNASDGDLKPDINEEDVDLVGGEDGDIDDKSDDDDADDNNDGTDDSDDAGDDNQDDDDAEESEEDDGEEDAEDDAEDGSDDGEDSDADGDSDSDNNDGDDTDEFDTESVLKEFSSRVDEGDTLGEAMNKARPQEFNAEQFEKDNQELFDKFNEANTNYQQAVIDQNKEDMAKYNGEMMRAQNAISRAEVNASASTNAQYETAKAAVQKALNEAIAQAQELYPVMNPKSDQKNPALIRVVNASFQAKLDEGISHVRALVEAVEEVALMKDLTPVGRITEESKEKKVANKTKKSVGKRIAASKKSPKRNKNSKNRGEKLAASNMKKATGKAFFDDPYVKDLGIVSDDFEQ